MINEEFAKRLLAIHIEQHPLAGETVKIRAGVVHPQYRWGLGGLDFRIEDWWDHLTGSSWMFANGNPACLVYAMRTGMSKVAVPIDDEVVYGHTKDGLGHLLHISEIEWGSGKDGKRIVDGEGGSENVG